MSLIYISNKRGPYTEPWGTPLVGYIYSPLISILIYLYISSVPFKIALVVLSNDISIISSKISLLTLSKDLLYLFD